MFRFLLTIALILFFSAGASVSPSPASGLADKNNPTVEQIVESVIVIYGGRSALTQIRRNGFEHGKISSVGGDGRTQEATYDRRFVRGENSLKDKVRLDQKMPSAEYALVYGEGRTWGIINGASFTPREEATTGFLSQLWHGVDALLRYKENGSTINLVGKDKQKGVEVYVVDLTGKDGRKTRYDISSKSFHVLWLEYEEPPAAGGTPVKYMRRFYDYRYAQGTLVPYRTVLYMDGKQVQETRVSTVTYGVKLDDALFVNPDAQATASQP